MMEWLPLAVTILLLAPFAWIGMLYLFRGTPMSKIRVLDDDGEPIAVSDDAFIEVMEAQCGVEFERNNQVDLLFNGDQTYPRLFEDLRRAEKLITFHVFW